MDQGMVTLTCGDVTCQFTSAHTDDISSGTYISAKIYLSKRYNTNLDMKNTSHSFIRETVNKKTKEHCIMDFMMYEYKKKYNNFGAANKT